MGFVGRVEIRGYSVVELFENFFLGCKRVELDSQELRDFNKIFRVVARVIVFARPVSRNGRAERNRREARTGTKKWQAAAALDSLKQDRPSLVCERVRHVIYSSI